MASALRSMRFRRRAMRNEAREAADERDAQRQGGGREDLPLHQGDRLIDVVQRRGDEDYSDDAQDEPVIGESDHWQGDCCDRRSIRGRRPGDRPVLSDRGMNHRIVAQLEGETLA